MNKRQLLDALKGLPDDADVYFRPPSGSVCRYASALCDVVAVKLLPAAECKIHDGVACDAQCKQESDKKTVIVMEYV